MRLKPENLAINGGPKAKTTPFGTGKRFAGNELKYLQEALESNTLFYAQGQMVKRACEAMKAYIGRPYAVACTSGSAAIHLGLAAAGVGPGDEVILTPNTDSGSALGIIAEGAVPVFCDCGWTLQPTVASVAARITPRTRAVIVIHLAGYAAPVDEIIALCGPRGIAVIEDCAQAWGTTLHGRRVGSFGTAGCYSINDYKHISAGDGGFVLLADETLYRRVHNYADKYYDRFFDGEQRQAHHGMNYRMSELQGAVACAQLERVEAITGRYHALGERLLKGLKSLRGARLVEEVPGSCSSYWWTALFVDENAVTVSRDRIVEALQAEGLPLASYGKYDLINTPLFRDRVVRPWARGAAAQYPLVQPDGRSYTYSLDDTPVHKRMLACGIQIWLNQFYTDRDIDETADGIRKVFDVFAR